MQWRRVAEQNRTLLLPRNVEVLGLIDTEDSDVCMSIEEFFDAWTETGSAPFQQCRLLLITGHVEFCLYAWKSGDSRLLKTPTGAVLYCA